MTKNGDIKKNYKKIIGIGVSILAIIIVFCMGFIWSKYISSAQGESTGTVAKWCFKLTNGISEYANITEFAVTRTDDSNVDRSTIAPGTRGKVEIDVDARGTETSLTYDIDVAFSNKQHNLKLFRQIIFNSFNFSQSSSVNVSVEFENNTNVAFGFISLKSNASSLF